MIKKEYGSDFEIICSKCSGEQIKENKNLIFFRSAREALLYVCDNLKEKTIILPSLCCDSMIQPFRTKKFNILYYDITEELKIDYKSLINVLKPNSLLLIMHYYGIRAYEVEELNKIISKYDNVKVIQDCTQNIFDSQLYDEIADFYIGSIRKWLAIPDGAFLKSNTLKLERANIENEDEEYVQKIYYAMQLKNEYLQTYDNNLKMKYRDLFKWGKNFLKKVEIPYKMSTLSKNIIENNIDIKDVIKKRRTNYNKLRGLITLKNPKILKYAREQFAPLMLPIIIDERDVIQKELAKMNIYCQVLWPISDCVSSQNNFNQWFSNHMLAIPCDQRYTEHDMEIIFNILLKVLEDNKRSL